MDKQTAKLKFLLIPKNPVYLKIERNIKCIFSIMRIFTTSRNSAVGLENFNLKSKFKKRVMKIICQDIF